jgi:site-specific DNA-methyltransferase (adenine-specific)
VLDPSNLSSFVAPEPIELGIDLPPPRTTTEILTMKKSDPILINQIRCCECVEGMRSLPDGCIDLTVTSPPYDEVREYGGHGWGLDKFKAIADELLRITTRGGVVVWVVQEQIRKGKESGTVSRQRLYFQDIGFDLYSTMIMVSDGVRLPQPRRYVNQFQHALVLSKGRPRSVYLLKDRPNSTAGDPLRGKVRDRKGRLEVRRYPDRVTGELGLRTNVWSYGVGWGKSTTDAYAFEHPALMPDNLARDHILSWSSPGDLVFDPMAGAATTCKMALLHNRKYLGFEIYRRYFRIAQRRMRDAHAQYRNKLDAWLMTA